MTCENMIPKSRQNSYLLDITRPTFMALPTAKICADRHHSPLILTEFLGELRNAESFKQKVCTMHKHKFLVSSILQSRGGLYSHKLCTRGSKSLLLLRGRTEHL